jgi:predicted GIY-YIG superfamily endonuclease
MVYLIHFDKAYKHARHYIGFTDDVQRRMVEHASGQGARILRIVKEAGIGWILARL